MPGSRGSWSGRRRSSRSKKSFRDPGNRAAKGAERRAELIGLAAELAESIGTQGACEALLMPPSSFYRQQCAAPQATEVPKARRGRSPRALSEQERQTRLEEFHSESFCDSAPAEVFATLADEGRYIGFVRMMYRILAKEGEVRERRKELRHPSYVCPQLQALALCAYKT